MGWPTTWWAMPASLVAEAACNIVVMLLTRVELSQLSRGAGQGACPVAPEPARAGAKGCALALRVRQGLQGDADSWHVPCSAGCPPLLAA